VNVCEPFIRRPVATTLLAIGLFILGIVAYHLLPVAPIPRVDFAMVSVSANLPGADPETVASSLAAPLERHLSQISGVTEITSSSTLGGTSISAQGGRCGARRAGGDQCGVERSAGEPSRAADL